MLGIDLILAKVSESNFENNYSPFNPIPNAKRYLSPNALRDML